MQSNFYLKYILQVVIILLMESASAYNPFYSESRRGWYWFEKENIFDTMNQSKINPEIATQIMKQFTADLYKARMQVFVQPTQQNMLDYLHLEEQMWKRSMKLFHLFEITKFKYPKFNDEPTNVETIRMHREQYAKLTKSNIADISKKFNLVIFISGKCKFCKEFEPILNNFAEQYNFNVEAVSIDDYESKYFITKPSPYLIKKLKIDATPILMAVHKNKPIYFELIRGFVSFSELENIFNLTKKYIDEKQI